MMVHPFCIIETGVDDDDDNVPRLALCCFVQLMFSLCVCECDIGNVMLLPIVVIDDDNDDDAKN